MSHTSYGLAFKAVIWVVLVIGIGFSVRAGHQLTMRMTYSLFSKPVEAVIDESHSFNMTVRKPRPTRYVERYRGMYGFDVQQSNGVTAHFTGTFNESSFLSIERVSLRKGDRLKVRYLSFNPSWSRPENEFGWKHLAIAGLIFTISVMCTGICALILCFLRSPSKAI